MPFIEFSVNGIFVLTSILDSYIVFLERTTNMIGRKLWNRISMWNTCFISD